MRLKSLAIAYCDYLDRKGPGFNLLVGAACTLLLGLIDYYSDHYFGRDYTLIFFYLLPIAFVAWFAGRNPAVVMSLACAAMRTASMLQWQEPFPLLLWRNGTALAFFLIIGLLLAKLRRLLDHERTRSRIDILTGVTNRTGFLDSTIREVFRLRRYGFPFSLAYIDLDNFKEVNDAHGHARGDFLLQKVASTIAHNLRRTDTVARFGGDEFTILLANTDENAAHAAIQKIREQLHEAMRRHDLNVTFSIGVLTCDEAPGSEEEVIGLADQLMYEVKRSGKDGLRHAVFTRLPQPAP